MVVLRRRPIEDVLVQLSWYWKNVEYEDEEMKNSDEKEMAIDSSSELFKLSDITEAIKCSNFNKGLGLDCFNGNIL